MYCQESNAYHLWRTFNFFKILVWIISCFYTNLCLTGKESVTKSLHSCWLSTHSVQFPGLNFERYIRWTKLDFCLPVKSSNIIYIIDIIHVNMLSLGFWLKVCFRTDKDKISCIHSKEFIILSRWKWAAFYERL